MAAFPVTVESIDLPVNAKPIIETDDPDLENGECNAGIGRGWEATPGGRSSLNDYPRLSPGKFSK